MSQHISYTYLLRFKTIATSGNIFETFECGNLLHQHCQQAIKLIFLLDQENSMDDWTAKY